MMRILFLLISVLFTFSPRAQAVVNGVLKNSQEHPAMALLALAKAPLSVEELGTTYSKDEIFKSKSLGICSGSFISDRIVLTAGHCISNESEASIPYLVIAKNEKYILIPAIQTVTDYVYENLAGVAEGNGCSPGPKPLPVTKTPDVALLLFPAGTSQHWLNTDFQYQAKINDSVEFYGFGTEYNPFDGSSMAAIVKDPKLRYGSSKVWRISPQRIGFVGTVMESFAADGDSGSAVLHNGKVVAVMSTVSERCETQFGEDYAILNTSSLLANSTVKSFVEKTLRQFSLIP